MEVRKRTIFLTIFSGDIPWNLGLIFRPYIYGWYLQFRFLKWTLTHGIQWGYGAGVALVKIGILFGKQTYRKRWKDPLNLRLNQRLNPRSRWMWTLGVGKGARPRLGVLLSLVVFLDLILLVATLGHLLESSENGQKRISWMREEVRRHVSSGSAASTTSTSWYSARARTKRSLVQNCRWRWWW